MLILASTTIPDTCPNSINVSWLNSLQPISVCQLGNCIKFIVWFSNTEMKSQ
jgi:hypothetical protein